MVWCGIIILEKVLGTVIFLVFGFVEWSQVSIWKEEVLFLKRREAGGVQDDDWRDEVGCVKYTWW